MGTQSLFCAACGLEAPIGVEMQPCAACHGTLFVPATWISWDAALTENDRKFLKSIRVAATTAVTT